jgi:hypothetical protein
LKSPEGIVSIGGLALSIAGIVVSAWRRAKGKMKKRDKVDEKSGEKKGSRDH